MIHVPLSRISQFFALLTTMVPLILDKKNKQRIYLKAHRIVSIITFNKNDDPPEILRKNSEVA